MFQVAVYGKGGIGKSTMSANISLALAGAGRSVMQVGCDPKHDSTRLLLGGRSQRTVLEYVREVPVGRRRLEDIIERGAGGVLCTEAGGPEPGIGCAGRGILTTFDTLSRLGADDMDVDIRLYDVLGDVVCGGFAVPLRDGYADAVIIVTSGEFMALYAANNIMRGMGNFGDRPRVLGIVLNSRGVEGEEETVRRFAEATGTEVIAVIPRDRLFAEAEGMGRTVVELYPDSDAALAMKRVADRVLSASDGEDVLTSPTPLDDLQLSDLAAGRAIRPPSGDGIKRNGCSGCRKSIADSRVMSSCAAYGAYAAYSRTGDTRVLVHGPMSCAYLFSTTRAKAVLELYRRGVYRGAVSCVVASTCMDEQSAINGGASMLERGLEEAVADGCRRIAVVTTCMPGIIGDDCGSVVDSFVGRNPGVSVDLVQADGDMTGDYNEGFMTAAGRIADRIDPSVQPERGLVNLIGPSFFDIQTPEHLRELEDMLGAFGLRVNCRFLDDCSPEPPEAFCRAATDILMSDSRGAREIMAMVTERTGREPFPVPMPLGMREYVRWAEEMGRFTGRADLAEREIGRAEDEYARFVDAHRSRMEGLTAIVRWKMGASPDWLMDVLTDLGVSVLRIGSAPGLRGGGPPGQRYPVTADYSDGDLDRDLEELRPSLLIADVVRPVPEGTVFAKISRMGVGYRPVFEYVRYLENSVRLPRTEGWREAAP